ncbi:hypothetical protein Tco_0792071 [Tanacetum coccineum]
MGMQPPQVVVNGVLNSLLKALFCRGSLTRVIVAAKIGGILASKTLFVYFYRQLWIRKPPATASESHWETKPSESNSDIQPFIESKKKKRIHQATNATVEGLTPLGFPIDSAENSWTSRPPLNPSPLRTAKCFPGNLGDRKTFCISSEANGQSRHSKASLNINATHETSVPMCADALEKAKEGSKGTATDAMPEAPQLLTQKWTLLVSSFNF